MFIKKRVPHGGDGQDSGPSSLFMDGAAESAASATPDNVIDVEPTPAAEPPASGRGGFGKFAKTKPAAAAAAVDAPVKKGLFGRGAKKQADAPAAEKKGGLFGKKGSESEKPKAKSTRTAAPKNSVDVLVELEGNKRVAWRLSSSQFEEVNPDQVARAISFSRNESRFSTETALSYGQAQDLALAEIGEDVRIVNATKQVKAVYASTAERITSLGGMETGPGLFLVELLLQGERQPGEELVCCVVLTGAQESRSLAVLYHFTKNDEVAATQITVNPDNLNFVLSQFAASRRLDGDNTRFVLFRNDDLLKIAGKLALYPNEAMWRGMSLRRVLWGAVVVAGAAAGIAGTYAGQAYVSKTLTQKSLSSASSQKQKAQKEIDALIGGSVVSFSRTQAMPLEQLTNRAGTLWFPGSRVVVDATPDKESYAVLMQLTRGGAVGNNPSVLHKATLEQVEPLLTIKPPEGCVKDVPQVSGGMNAVQITVACENPASPLAAYRLN